MRYGLAFYELDGPLFALASGRRSMSLYVAEQEVVIKHKDALPGVNSNKSFIKFLDLNRLPLDIVERIVRDSVTARRDRVNNGAHLTQEELLKLWDIQEEAAATTTIITKPGVQAPMPPKLAAKVAAKKAAAKKAAATKAAKRATQNVSAATKGKATKPIAKQAHRSAAKPLAKRPVVKTGKAAPKAAKALRS